MKININRNEVSWQKLLSKNLHESTDSKPGISCSCNDSNNTSQQWPFRGRLLNRGFLSRNLLVTILCISLVNVLLLSSVVESHQFSSCKYYFYRQL